MLNWFSHELCFYPEEDESVECMTDRVLADLFAEANMLDIKSEVESIDLTNEIAEQWEDIKRVHAHGLFHCKQCDAYTIRECHHQEDDNDEL
ncbi:hypothetical protein [Baia soyae]|uniref:Uncharacterized protein n=1 Tax=Baia soyae TaxID=1544746 RepID=A0A4R2RN88_9BACL|nr:hypothetical protein [Baia soyae]TCP61241.1 hypothetical protein EDD57_1647 [Baia soyae]